ncbi:uncharacterized protein LOC128551811 [Mercenaria mercenaria]|uniref:uncharacterized protein LOC128551811 n=1 Tax=Mercenaria mercenaria TaxID=6596 RepID=UPI00234F86F0|nr:uncharacterized protein LOC128551811 [Mercenaria mercenaria]
MSGDVHPNPGPVSTRSNSASSVSSSSTVETIDLSSHFSFMHYNVQSIKHKLETLYAEFKDFDILSFSETWLNASTLNNDLIFDGFHDPERKDRPANSHGGVLLYVKEQFRYKRRHDLEIQSVECIWIELITKTKRILFGTFYRPPNTTAPEHSLIEDCIHLAVDTGIPDIIVTGDFNINMQNPDVSRKISSLCQRLSLTQCISDPTHFTENSSSLIDIILTSNHRLIHASGVGVPCLDQQVRFHCPIFGLINFKKSKIHTFKRHIWLFDKGNYQLLREKAANINWHQLKHTNINTYTKNITDTILSISKSCIPNKDVTIRPSDPPWFPPNLKKMIRQRRRYYKKAQHTNTEHDWLKFRTLRNKIITTIRQSKEKNIHQLATNLKTIQQNSKSWWACLKSFIKPASSSSSSIPPLQDGDDIAEDDQMKADILNDYFRDQTLLSEPENIAPELKGDISPLSTMPPIQVYPDEVMTVLKTLPLGKAAGPDGINNRILKELCNELSTPLADLFNKSLTSSEYPDTWKEAFVTPIFKTGDRSVPEIIVL